MTWKEFKAQGECDGCPYLKLRKCKGGYVLKDGKWVEPICETVNDNEDIAETLKRGGIEEEKAQQLAQQAFARGGGRKPTNKSGSLMNARQKRRQKLREYSAKDQRIREAQTNMYRLYKQYYSARKKFKEGTPELNELREKYSEQRSSYWELVHNLEKDQLVK